MIAAALAFHRFFNLKKSWLGRGGLQPCELFGATFQFGTDPSRSVGAREVKVHSNSELAKPVECKGRCPCLSQRTNR
jgi:hypothetical protein